MAPVGYELKKKLAVHGYKYTNQRQAVLEVMLQHKKQHLCVEELYDDMKKDYPHIGVATVYRTVQILNKIGFVQHISLEDGILRYQIIDSEEKHEHHHLICEICGKIIDVQEDMLECLEEQVYVNEGFKVTNHKVKVFGICKNCLEKMEEKNKEENYQTTV